MISLIFGSKGTGKTKQIIECANAEVQHVKGDIVFVDKDNRKMYELSHKIRLVDGAEYGLSGGVVLTAFIKGLLAGNKDIETIYIDGMASITGVAPEEAKTLYEEIEGIATKFEVKFVITVSTEKLPEFLEKYKVIKSKAV